MCNPAFVMVGVAIASSVMAASSQRQQSNYASAVANENAKAATEQANDAINRGNAAAEQRRVQMRQQLGTQAATMGASGADLTSGSALDIAGDTAQFGSLDSLTTLNNAQREAYGYQVQSNNFYNQASAATSQGNTAIAQTLMTTPLKAYGAYQMGGGTWSPFMQKAAPISAAVGTPTGR